ncbi:hypothetical protein CCH79_00010058 [Gambusia affinis]|uniref:Uncharacterized protein n=1 Tax=Gambusia affinis TaxID=33528 RepID=A0A315VNQ4_GAMAF|nr:hypothetical protein CCH79_00010058 [Gambusia affinis]
MTKWFSSLQMAARVSVCVHVYAALIHGRFQRCLPKALHDLPPSFLLLLRPAPPSSPPPPPRAPGSAPWTAPSIRTQTAARGRALRRRQDSEELDGALNT